MAKSIFQLSLEDDNVEGSVEVPVETVTEQVAEQDQATEVATDVAEAEEQVENFENAIEVQEEIENQVEEQEAVLEQKPEEVTEEVVEVAQEAFAISLGRLHLSYEEYKSLYRDNYRSQLSFESAETLTPVKKLTIATEGMKEILTTIKEKILAIFRAIGNTFRKLWQKFIILMDGTEKKAKALAEKIKAGDVKDSLSEDEKAKIAKIFPLDLDIVKYGNISKLRTTIFKGFALVAIKDDQELIKATQKLNADALRIENKLSFTADGNSVFVTRAINSNFKGISINSNNGQINIVSGDDVASKITIKREAKDVTPLTKDQVLKALDVAGKNAKDIKKFVDDVNKVRDESEKAIKDFKPSDDQSEPKKKALAAIQKVGTSACLDITADFIDYNKGIVTIANIHVK